MPSGCPSNCISCNFEGKCTQCADGYAPHNGVCVCAIPNCLDCWESICVQCVPPLIPSPLDGTRCVPMITPFTQCSVDNCAQCYLPNRCSICFPGYTLSLNGTCEKINCTTANCELCSFLDETCFQCEGNYMPTQFLGTNCTLVYPNYECNVESCAYCTSPNVCHTCAQMYTLTSSNTC